MTASATAWASAIAASRVRARPASRRSVSRSCPTAFVSAARARARTGWSRGDRLVRRERRGSLRSRQAAGHPSQVAQLLPPPRPDQGVHSPPAARDRGFRLVQGSPCILPRPARSSRCSNSRPRAQPAHRSAPNCGRLLDRGRVMLRTVALLRSNCSWTRAVSPRMLSATPACPVASGTLVANPLRRRNASSSRSSA